MQNWRSLAPSVLATAAFVLPSPFSHAQTAPLIIDQQRIDRAQTPPASETGPSTLRGRLEIEGAATGQTLQAVRIRGSSLSPESLETTWRAHVGAPADSQHVTAIVTALSELYANSDIALYSILTPSSAQEPGVVDLIIVEGHIANVVVETDDADARDLQRARVYAAQLTQERPLRKQTLHRYISLIRDIPGQRITAELQPAPQAGAATLKLTARRNAVDGGVSISNRATPLLGSTQVSADLTLNGILRGGDSTTFGLTTSAQDDLFTFVLLAHATPLGDDGGRLAMNISHLETRPNLSIASGTATAGGVSFSYPFIRGYERNLIGTVALDSLDTSNAVLGQAIDSSRTRVLRGGLSFSDADAEHAATLSLSASIGRDWLGARLDTRFADLDFAKLSLQGGWEQTLAASLALRLRLQAQTSRDMLPSSEQFTLGGEQFGRAYPSAIVQGDQGIAASIETAYRFGAGLPAFAEGSEAYVFADAGRTWLNERPLFFDAQDFSLSSAGAGLRFMLPANTKLGLEFAHGLEAPYPAAKEEWQFIYRLTTRQ